MKKDARAMGKTPRPDGRTPNVVPLYPAQEEADATALAHYWDARLQGQPVADTDLDPGLRDMVHLLEHYREVTGPAVPAATASPLWRPGHYAALVVLAAAFLLFTSNTFLSPRSWLLSSARDPDWIPWVSDDWLGRDVPSAGSVISQLTAPLTIIKEFTHGA